MTDISFDNNEFTATQNPKFVPLTAVEHALWGQIQELRRTVADFMNMARSHSNIPTPSIHYGPVQVEVAYDSFEYGLFGGPARQNDPRAQTTTLGQSDGGEWKVSTGDLTDDDRLQLCIDLRDAVMCRADPLGDWSVTYCSDTCDRFTIRYEEQARHRSWTVALRERRVYCEQASMTVWLPVEGRWIDLPLHWVGAIDSRCYAHRPTIHATIIEMVDEIYAKHNWPVSLDALIAEHKEEIKSAGIRLAHYTRRVETFRKPGSASTSHRLYPYSQFTGSDGLVYEYSDNGILYGELNLVDTDNWVSLLNNVWSDYRMWRQFYDALMSHVAEVDALVAAEQAAIEAAVDVDAPASDTP